jgi:Ca-activated chloride channel homolog
MQFRNVMRGFAAFVLLAAGAFPADPFRLSIDSRLVLIPVTVTDRDGKTLTGLEAEHFQIADGAEARSIESLVRHDAPVSFGIVVDLSGSMNRKLPEAIAAVRAIVNAAQPGDDAFLVTFSDRPEIRAGFTTDFASLPNRLLRHTASGGTAMFDAVYLALHELRGARNPRKALIVISDGNDNQSRYTRTELFSVALESDAQIYTLGMADEPLARGTRAGVHLLEELSARTGGLHYTVRSHASLARQAGHLAEAMRCLYVLGFRPPEDAEPGKWRRVRVTVTPGSGQAVRVAARSGYFSPD